MTNIRCIISSTSRTINRNNLKQKLCFTLNLNTKGKGNIMSDVYVNTSVPSIWNYLASKTSVSVTSNGFVKVSRTGRNVTQVVFDHDLSKKLILIRDSRGYLDLPNGTSVSHLKVTPLLDGGKISSLSIAQYCDSLYLKMMLISTIAVRNIFLMETRSYQ